MCVNTEVCVRTVLFPSTHYLEAGQNHWLCNRVGDNSYGHQHAPCTHARTPLASASRNAIRFSGLSSFPRKRFPSFFLVSISVTPIESAGCRPKVAATIRTRKPCRCFSVFSRSERTFRGIVQGYRNIHPTRHFRSRLDTYRTIASNTPRTRGTTGRIWRLD